MMLKNQVMRCLSVFCASVWVSAAIANPSEAPASSRAPALTATAAAAATPSQQHPELTVEGTIKKLVSKKKEIYVSPKDGGKKFEFYFPDNAQFFKAGQSVGFDALKEGQKVRVTYTQTGRRLNPVKAEILE